MATQQQYELSSEFSDRASTEGQRKGDPRSYESVGRLTSILTDSASDVTSMESVPASRMPRDGVVTSPIISSQKRRSAMQHSAPHSRDLYPSDCPSMSRSKTDESMDDKEPEAEVVYIEGPPGPQGPQGIPGPQGPYGPLGPAGPRGPQGPQGPRGLTGYTGPNGLEGPQGRPGPKGDRGEIGPVGQQGPAGPEGPPGPRGGQGPAGPPGIQGKQGLIGPAGPRGEQGKQGNRGDQGNSGPAGPAGVRGPCGPQGSVGPAGPQGSVGPEGAQGAPGPQGPPGPRGLPGERGEEGKQGVKGDQGEQGPPGVCVCDCLPGHGADQRIIIVNSDYQVKATDRYIVIKSQIPRTLILPTLSPDPVPIGVTIETKALHIRSLVAAGPHKLVVGDPRNNINETQASITLANHQAIALVPINQTWYTF